MACKPLCAWVTGGNASKAAQSKHCEPCCVVTSTALPSAANVTVFMPPLPRQMICVSGDWFCAWIAGAAMDTPKLSKKAKATVWIKRWLWRLRLRRWSRRFTGSILVKSVYHAPMTRRDSASKINRTAQALLWLLLIGFAWMQFLGTAHRYFHPLDANSVSTPSARVTGLLDHAPLAKQDGTKDGVTCQLFDLACSGAALRFVLPAWQTPTLLPAKPLIAACAVVLCRSAQPYQARAPPTLI